ncbi:hypothetical protein WG906_17880 [Pedobacter sp. P351]|uniref:hypothetical protein n=1 Tax=Pedobacter superstes TaxID=3133441 RepID=UPI00309D36CD
MRLSFLFICLIGSCLICFGQFGPIPRISQNDPTYSNPFEQKIKKHGKYKRNVWKYIYEVEMKDGSNVQANSDILKDSISGKHFLYSSNSNSLKQIFAGETSKITRPDPYNMKQTIEGLPNGDKWRFAVIKGKINAFCFFVKGNEINEIQLNGADIIPFNTEHLKSLIKNSAKALKAFDQKDYYTAINIFNRQNID